MITDCGPKQNRGPTRSNTHKRIFGLEIRTIFWADFIFNNFKKKITQGN